MGLIPAIADLCPEVQVCCLLYDNFCYLYTEKVLKNKDLTLTLRHELRPKFIIIDESGTARSGLFIVIDESGTARLGLFIVIDESGTARSGLFIVIDE